jgi:type II secretory pathway pseudopilin PulG
VTRARGFSLVEALAATVLLAVVAVACVPILRAAAAGAGSEGSEAGNLGQLADRVAASPESFGLTEPDARASIPWPDDIAPAAGTSPVHARLLVRATQEKFAAPDRWIVLESGQLHVARWLPPPRSNARPSSPRPARRRGATRRRRSSTSRGITLVETLAALSITAMLAVAVVGWSVTSTQAAAASQRRSRSADATEAALRVIREDLLVGDFDDPSRARGDQRVERVRADAGGITVRTRRPGPGGETVRRYVLDQRARAVVVYDLREGQEPSRATAPQALVGEVREFSAVEQASGSGTRRSRSIVVTLGLTDGETVRRRIPVP